MAINDVYNLNMDYWTMMLYIIIFKVNHFFFFVVFDVTCK